MASSSDDGSKVFLVSILAGLLLLAIMVMCVGGFLGFRGVAVPGGPRPPMTTTLPGLQSGGPVLSPPSVVPRGNWTELQWTAENTPDRPWLVDGEPMALDEVVETIRRSVNAGEETRLRIVRTEEVPNEAIEELIQQIRTLGVTSYEIVDESEQQDMNRTRRTE